MALLANWLTLFTVNALFLPVAAAEEVYQTSEDFVTSAFAGEMPTPELLWVTGSLRDEASTILGHPPDTLRTRYWRKDQRTAWILEEIGKESPITVGLVVQDGQLETIKVLVYRESRGWEVRHDFFTRQFWQARLQGKNELDRTIDGIAGATLSVNSMRKVARLALLYHRHVTADAAT
jgi:hypothetical protein